LVKRFILTTRIKIWIIATIIFIVALFICISCLPPIDRTFINILNIVGLILSIIGILIAYLQILSIKEVTLAIQTEVKESLKKNKSMLLISDISKKVSMITEIQGFLRFNKIEMCVLRMKDLKLLLSDLNSDKQFSSLVNKREFGSSYSDFHIDLGNFHKFLLNEKNIIDKEKINANLEQLSTILLGVEFKLKKQ